MNKTENGNKPKKRNSRVSFNLDNIEVEYSDDNNMLTSDDNYDNFGVGIGDNFVHDVNIEYNDGIIEINDSYRTMSVMDRSKEKGIRKEIGGVVYECQTIDLHKKHPHCYSKYGCKINCF